MKYRSSHDVTPAQHQLDPLKPADAGQVGRPNIGTPPAHGVRLFALVLTASGHDKGGAFWGHGATVYCATNYKTYQAFYRQAGLTRDQAITALGLTPDDLLLKKSNR